MFSLDRLLARQEFHRCSYYPSNYLQSENFSTPTIRFSQVTARRIGANERLKVSYDTSTLTNQTEPINCRNFNILSLQEYLRFKETQSFPHNLFPLLVKHFIFCLDYVFKTYRSGVVD